MFLRTRIALIGSTIAVLLSLIAPAGYGIRIAQAAAQAPAGWQMVWDDEFNGSDGSAPDATKWSHDTGGAWGNGTELQYYTDRTANASIQNGNLQITANKEDYLGNHYTSARLESHGKFAQQYGRFEARIKIPAGQGIWPAFWLLGDNIDQVNWPACGEIDVMEHINNNLPIVSTLHMPDLSGSDTHIGANYALAGGADYTTDFHLFAAEWDPDAVRFYVDNTLFQTVTRTSLPSGSRWVFDHPFFIILNVAVGGTWPGSPDSTTTFPQTMLVDYVRVYTRVATQSFYFPIVMSQ